MTSGVHAFVKIDAGLPSALREAPRLVDGEERLGHDPLVRQGPRYPQRPGHVELISVEEYLGLDGRILALGHDNARRPAASYIFSPISGLNQAPSKRTFRASS
jgi:hypothetical protein